MKKQNAFLVIIFSVVFFHTALSQDKLYFSQLGDNPQIYRCNTDGSEIESMNFDIEFDHPEDIEVDTLSQTIFWTDYINGEGIIRKAKLDGSDIQSIFFPEGNPRRLWLDIENQEIYWTDDDLNVIRKANADLENVETLPIDMGLNGALGIDIDLKHGIIYWTDWVSDDLWRANMDGSDQSLIYDQRAGYIKLDPNNEFIYCSNNLPGIIFRLNIDGSNRFDLLTGMGNLNSFDINFENNTIYWTDSYNTDSINYVYRANLDDLVMDTIIHRHYSDRFHMIKHVKAHGSVATNYNEISNDYPFSVFPNPFKDNIHIEGLSEQSEYRLYRIDGALMITGRLNENILDTDYIPPGNYILMLSVKGKWHSKRIVKF